MSEEEDFEIMMRIGDGTFRYETIKSVSVYRGSNKFSESSAVKITFLDSEDHVIVTADDPKAEVKKAEDRINEEISRQIKYQMEQREKMQRRSQLGGGGAPQF